MIYKKITPYIHFLIDKVDRKKTTLEFIYSNGGSWFEKNKDRGRKHLLEHCIASRSKSMNFGQFKDYTFKENISTNAYTSPTSLAVQASGHYEDFTKIFDLLFEIFTEPTFDEEGLNREREIVLRETNEYLGDPNYKKYYDVIKKLFSKDSYNTHEVLGDPENVKNTKLEDFYRLHKQNLEESHLIFCLSGGGVDVDYAENKINNFIDLNKTSDEVKALLNADHKKPLAFGAENQFLEIENKLGIYHEHGHEHAELSIYLPCKVDFENKPIREIFSGVFLRYNCGGLYDLLRDELGLIYGYYSEYDKYSQNLVIEMNCELDAVKKIVSEVENFFSDFDSHFKKNKFEEYKSLIKKKQDLAKDNLGADAKLVVKNMLVYGEVEAYDEYSERVDKVGARDIKNFYNQIKEGLSGLRVVVVSNQKSVENIFE